MTGMKMLGLNEITRISSPASCGTATERVVSPVRSTRTPSPRLRTAMSQQPSGVIDISPAAANRMRRMPSTTGESAGLVTSRYCILQV